MKQSEYGLTSRVLSVVLALFMIVSMVPATVFAQTANHPGVFTFEVTDSETGDGINATVAYTVLIDGVEAASNSVTATDGEAVITEIADRAEDLAAGRTVSISYTVSAAGYETRTGTALVTDLAGTVAVALTAQQAEPPANTVTVNVSVTGSGSVTRVTDEGNVDIGTSLTVTKGETVKLSALAAEGYYLSSVKVDGASRNAPHVTDAWAFDVYTDGEATEISVTVEFKALLNVAAAAVDNGTITLAKDGETGSSFKVIPGKQVTVTVTPDANCRILEFSGNNQVVTNYRTNDDGSITSTFTVTADITFSATIAVVYNVTVSVNGSGAVTVNQSPAVSGNSVEILSTEADSISVSAQPAEHYRVSSVKINGLPDADFVTANDAVFNKDLPLGSYEIDIEFALNQYNASVAIELPEGTEPGAGGTATLSNTTLNYGDSVLLTVNAADGWYFAGLRIAGKTDEELASLVTDNKNGTYSVKITENTAITVLFKQIETVKIDSFGVSVAPSPVKVSKANGSYLRVFGKDTAAMTLTAAEGFGLTAGAFSTDYAPASVSGTVSYTGSVTVEMLTVYKAGSFGYTSVTRLDASLILIKDAKAPTIKLTEVNGAENAAVARYYTDAVTLAFETEDPNDPGSIASAFSGLLEITTVVTVGEGNQKTEVKKETKTFEQVTKKDSFTFTLDTEKCNRDDMTVTVTVKDQAGNEETFTSDPITICTEAPTVSASITGERDANADKDGNYYKDGRTLTFTVTNNGRNVLDYEKAQAALKIYKDGADISSTIVWTLDAEKHEAQVIYDFVEDGYYTWSFEGYENLAGIAENKDARSVKGSDPYEFGIDKAAPGATVNYEIKTFDKILETITFGVYTGNEINVSAEGEDNASGVKSVDYYKTTDLNLLKDADLNTAFNTLEDLYKNGEFSATPVSVSPTTDEDYYKAFVVYIRVCDNAGNVTFVSTNGLILDDKPVIIEIAPQEGAPEAVNGFYNSDLPIVITATESNRDENDPSLIQYSGIKSVSWVVLKNWTNDEDGGISYTEADVTQRGSIAGPDANGVPAETLIKASRLTAELTIDAEKNNSDTVVLLVTAEDNAGNVSQKTVHYKFNTNTPEIVAVFEPFDTELKAEDDSQMYNSAKITLSGDRVSAFNSDINRVFVNDTEHADEVGIHISAVDSNNEPVKECQPSFTEFKLTDETNAEYTAELTLPEGAQYSGYIVYSNLAGNAADIGCFQGKKNDDGTVTADALFDADAPHTFAFIWDTTPPTGTVTIDKNVWNKLLETITFGLYSQASYTVKIDAHDDTCSVKAEYLVLSVDDTDFKAYSIDTLEGMYRKEGGNDFVEYKGEFTVEGNRNFVVVVRLKDFVGNYDYICSDGHIIDKIDPRITKFEPADPPANGCFNSNVTINWEVSDVVEGQPQVAYSGIKTVRYWIDGDKDNAVTVFSYAYEDAYTVGSVAEGEEPTSMAALVYQGAKQHPLWDEIRHTISTITTEERKADEDALPIIITAEDHNSSDVAVTLQVIDNAGNDKEETIYLDIDVTAPELSVEFADQQNDDACSGYYTSRTATLTVAERSNHFEAETATEGIIVTAADAAGNSLIAEDGSNSAEYYTISSWTTVTSAESPDKDIHTATVSFFGDANYTFAFSYTDKAGNAGTFKEYNNNSEYTTSFTVDNTAPTAAMFIRTAERKADEQPEPCTALVKDGGLFFGVWSREEIRTSASMRDETSPIQRVDYYVQQFDAKAAADGTVKEKPYEDKELENIYSEEKKFTSVIHLLDADGLLKYDETFTDDAADKLFSIFNYNKAQGDMQYIVYLRIEDAAGNVTYVSTNGLIVDHTLPLVENTAPKISIQLPENGRDLYNGNVTLQVKVEDPIEGKTYSGLKSISYQIIDRTGQNPESENATVFTFEKVKPTQEELAAARTKSFSITVDSTKFNSNDIQVIVYAMDNAGNGAQAESVFAIDVTKPVVTVSYDNNNADSEKYFNVSRTAVIAIRERNFDPDHTVVSFNNKPVAIKWVLSEKGQEKNGDGTVYTAKIPFTVDGDYSLTGITTVDLAGNSNLNNNGAGVYSFAAGTVAGQNFTIDQTQPRVSVSYTDSQKANAVPGYYTARTAVVTIEERNFTWDRVKIELTATVDNQPIAAPTPVFSDSRDGLSHVATITYNVDAHYKFNMSMTDLAGNAAAAPDAEFDVDGTDPQFDITGLEKDFYGENDDLNPSVKFTDINLREEAKYYSATLTRYYLDKKEEVDISGHLAHKGHVYGGLLDVFEKIRAKDGRYVLDLSVMDKAGNVTSKTFKFVVNRFGSLYEYGDTVKEILQTPFLQQVDKALKIFEYNPNALKELSVVIMRDRDQIDPEELKDEAGNSYIKQTKDEDAERNQWNTYTYTIDPAVFQLDGEYKIIFYSKDDQNQSSTNTSAVGTNYKEIDSLVFTVDHTAPEVQIITGMEKKIVNGTEQKITYTINDHGGIAEIQVFHNGDQKTITLNGQTTYTGEYTLTESDQKQSFTLRITDRAGNVTNTASTEFNPGSVFVYNREILVSSNFFVRFYGNKPAFYGTIGGAAGAAALAGAIVGLRKRKKKKEA